MESDKGYVWSHSYNKPAKLMLAETTNQHALVAAKQCTFYIQ
jgi:hypothetical protein